MASFKFKKFARSFKYAGRGLVHLIQTEQNAQVHLLATVLLGALALYFKLSATESAVLFFAVVLVFAIEIINTAVEKLLDIVHPEHHSQIAFIKDALAGSVLIAAVIAFVVAVALFWPHIKLWL